MEERDKDDDDAASASSQRLVVQWGERAGSDVITRERGGEFGRGARASAQSGKVRAAVQCWNVGAQRTMGIPGKRAGQASVGWAASHIRGAVVGSCLPWYIRRKCHISHACARGKFCPKVQCAFIDTRYVDRRDFRTYGVYVFEGCVCAIGYMYRHEYSMENECIAVS